MAGFCKNDATGGTFQFHIDTPNVVDLIRHASSNRRVITLQLDGDELEAALWGMENYKKAPDSPHRNDIALLRRDAVDVGPEFAAQLNLAADLLELHDRTGISLDNWEAAKTFVERKIGHSIKKNGA